MFFLKRLSKPSIPDKERISFLYRGEEGIWHFWQFCPRVREWDKNVMFICCQKIHFFHFRWMDRFWQPQKVKKVVFYLLFSEHRTTYNAQKLSLKNYYMFPKRFGYWNRDLRNFSFSAASNTLCFQLLSIHKMKWQKTMHPINSSALQYYFLLINEFFS